MEELSPGEKIKKLRLELGLKQDDITSEKVSKSLISMIEKNKRGLTWNTAAIIAECFNKYYREMGKEITAEYLLETEMDRIKRELKEEMKYLQTLIKAPTVNDKLVKMSFRKLLDIAKEHNLKREMAEILFLRAGFHYNFYQYNKALQDCSNILEYYIETKDYTQMFFTYNMMGACYHMQMIIEQALTYYAKAYDIACEQSMPNKTRLKIEAIFNLIICNRKIYRYDMALQYLGMFKEIEWEDPMYQFYNNQLLLVEANTYRDIKNYERAEKLYDKLQLKGKELAKDTLFLLYDNYTMLYIKQGQIEKALEYVNKAFEVKQGVSIHYIPWIFVNKAKCLMTLGKIDETLDILNDGLILAEEVNINEIIIDFHFTLAQVYILQKDYDSGIEHLEFAEKIIFDKDIKLKKNDLYSFYIEVYLELDQKDKCLEYVSKIRKDYLAVQ